MFRLFSSNFAAKIHFLTAYPMSGLYLHIPFCKKACHYCDFHFSTSLQHKGALVDAMIKEIAAQKDYLPNRNLQSVYFGGGTPSLLSPDELQRIFDAIHQHFEVEKGAEITLEANPDDLQPEKLAALLQTPVNRLSIGVQSFFDEDLRWMNRAHNRQDAERSIAAAQDAGLENITIDLIYGYPLLTHEKWQHNLEKALALNIPHISSYCLTVEPKTALHKHIQSGTTPAPDEQVAAAQFEYLMDQLQQQGWEHYEISNFCKPGKMAVHNSNYWRGADYLGIGPSAHSFNGHSRQWNVANNAQYLRALQAGEIPFTLEILDPLSRYNEWIMTRLRTRWGIDVQEVKTVFGEVLSEALSQQAATFVTSGWLSLDQGVFTLTRAGKLYADHIASELFQVGP